MELAEVTDRLDEIAWQEQTNFELSERPDTAHAPQSVEPELRALGAELDPALLDALEREEGYLVWALRLAPYVANSGAPQRAARYVDDADPEVRSWARELAPPAP